MRRHTTAIALLATALSVAAIAAQQPLFRSGTELVDLFVTVTEDNGRLVPGLLQEDFAIFDEGEDVLAEASQFCLKLLLIVLHLVNIFIVKLGLRDIYCQFQGLSRCFVIISIVIFELLDI